MAPANTSRATEVRSKRATLKRAIKSGDVDGLEVLAGHEDPWREEVASGMPLEALLRAIPGVGPLAVANLIARFDLRPDVRLYGLTHELRRELAAATRREINQ